MPPPDSAKARLKAAVGRFIPKSLRGQLYRKLETSRSARSLLTRLPAHARLDGGRFLTDTGQPDPQMRLSLLTGVHESSERELVERHLVKGLPVLELGAGIGVVSHLAWNVAASSSSAIPRMAVVEANPAVAAVLRRNLTANRIVADVVEAAVSYGKSEVFIDIPKARWVGATVRSGEFSSARPNGTGSTTLTVAATTLRELCERVMPEASCPDELQLVADIEGAEWEVFENDGELLSERFTVVIAELHGGTRADGKDVIERAKARLGPLGFDLVESLGGAVAFRKVY